MRARVAFAISSETNKVNFLKRQATCYDVNGYTLKFGTDLAQIIKKEKHRMTIYSKQAGWLNFASVGHFPSSLDLLYSPWKTNPDHFSESLFGKVFILNRDYLHLAIDTLTQAKCWHVAFSHSKLTHLCERLLRL